MCAKLEVESRCCAREREEDTAPRGRVVVQIRNRFERRVRVESSGYRRGHIRRVERKLVAPVGRSLAEVTVVKTAWTQ